MVLDPPEQLTITITQLVKFTVALTMLTSLTQLVKFAVALTMLTSSTTGTYHVDLIDPAGQVHLAGVVGPGPELQVAALIIEGEVGDVDVADCLEDTARLPVHETLVRDDGAELGVITVNLFSPAARNKR